MPIVAYQRVGRDRERVNDGEATKESGYRWVMHSTEDAIKNESERWRETES